MRKIGKYQAGGPLDINAMLSGLFPENDYDFGYDQSAPTADSVYPGLEKKYLSQAKRGIFGNVPFIDKKIAQKKARKEAEKIVNDPSYQQNVFADRKQTAVADYFKSDYFKDGMQGIFGMQQDIQDQTDAEKDPIEIDQYRVGPDQGFALSFQKGGPIPKTSTLGYKTGSPDEKEKALTIKGNKITMNGVDKALLLVPSSGEPIYAEPNSGDYYFPGATEVVEYPIETFQQGGTVGDPREQAGYAQNKMSQMIQTMAPALMQDGGQVEEPVPVQLEKGEEIIFEDMSIVQPKAKKRHSQMDDYTYTDVLPPGAYVASRDKSQVLDRGHAENMQVSGMGPMEYDEKDATPIRKEKNLGMMFRKKKEAPASVAKRIRSKIPTTTNDDLFGKNTNLLNLQTRTPYVNALISMAEENRKGLQAEGGEEIKQYGGFAEYKDGGRLPYPVDKHQIGALIGAGASIIGGIISGIGAGKARRSIEENRDASLADISKFEQNSNNRAGIGLGMGTASVLGQFASQDTSYDYLNLDPLRTRTQNALTTAGQNIDLQDRIADQMQQAPLSTVARSASYGDPRAGIQAYDSAYTNFLNSSNQRKLGSVGMQTDLLLTGAEALNKIDLPEIMDTQKGKMYTKTSNNLLNQGLFAGLGKEGQNYLSNRDRIEGAATSARMAARGQATSALNNIPFMVADSVERIGAGVSTFATTYSNRATTNAGSINFNKTQNRWDNAPPSFTTNSGYYPGWTWNSNSGMYEQN